MNDSCSVNTAHSCFVKSYKCAMLEKMSMEKIKCDKNLFNSAHWFKYCNQLAVILNLQALWVGNLSIKCLKVC